MYLSCKNFAGDFLALFLFIIHTQRACVRACVKAFGAIVLHGIASRKTTVFTSYRAEDFKSLNKKHAKKLLPVF